MPSTREAITSALSALDSAQREGRPLRLCEATAICTALRLSEITVVRDERRAAEAARHAAHKCGWTFIGACEIDDAKVHPV